MWASRRLCSGLVGKNTWARVEALQRNQAFIGRYREARANHLAGRGALFPAGTLPAFSAAPRQSRSLPSTRKR
jgi:hypothetical protein